MLSLIGYFCSPVEELACTLAPEALTQPLIANDVIHVAIDNADMQGAGLGTLRITPL